MSDDRDYRTMAVMTLILTAVSAAAAWWDGRNPFLWGMVAFFVFSTASTLLLMWCDRIEKARPRGEEARLRGEEDGHVDGR